MRVRSIAAKEVRHVLRDPFTLALALGLPILLVTFFGFAIDLESKGIGLFVQDRDHSRPSRELAEVFFSSDYFRPEEGARATATLVIEPGFGKEVRAGEEVSAQLLLDGADNARAGAVLGYVPGLAAAAGHRLGYEGGMEGVRLKTRFLYNPELSSRWFIIPGLGVVVMGLLSIMLTALTVAREWENGSMELLLSTPVRPREIIMGKLLPYVALCLVGVVTVYLTARLGFGVPFRGSHILFAVSSLMYLVACLSWGLLVSVATRRQDLAMQFAIVSGLLPSFLLSGFVFPIESMPAFFQAFTSILPQKWYMVLSRDIFLKGAGVSELLKPLGALLLMDLVLISAAIRRFKGDLEP